MIKRIMLGCCALVLLWGEATFAENQSSNPPAGYLFNTVVNDLTLNITSTIPNRCYDLAGIKSLSPFVSLQVGGVQCSANANGYCSFRACDTTPTAFTYTGPAGSTDFKLCLNAQGDTSGCQKLHLMTQYAYVAGESDGVRQCPLNPDGSFGTCSVLTPRGGAQWTGPFKIAFPRSEDKDYSYIADGDGTGQVFSCALNNNNDTYTTCVESTGFDDACQVAFSRVSRTHYAYVADYGPGTSITVSPGTVWQCDVSSVDGSLNTCTQQTPTGVTWGTPSGITTKEINETKYAYVSDTDESVTSGAASAVYQCVIDSSNGSLSSCSQTPTTNPGWSPWEVAFQKIGETEYAYVADGNGYIWQCGVNPATGSFNNTSCSQLNPSFAPSTPAYTEPYGVAFAKTGNVLHAYVSDNGTGQVYECTLNSDGTFNTCMVTPDTMTSWTAQGVTILSRD